MRKFANIKSTNQKRYKLFLQISEYFLEILDFVEIFHFKLPKKIREASVCAKNFPQNLQHKGDISFIFQTKSIIVVISCDLSLGRGAEPGLQ